MKKKIPVLSIVAIIHIIYTIFYYQKFGKQGDHEGWGLLAAGILVGAGVVAIIIDLILMRFIKEPKPFLIAEIIVIVIGAFIFYI